MAEASKRVVVIGAGVMGLVLGKELASRGIDVTIYDSKRSVSENTARASGIFSTEGLERIGVDHSKAMLNTLDGAIIHGGGEDVEIRSPKTMAYVLDRGLLAEACADTARKAGAKIELNRRFTRDEILEICADKGNIVVGADGAVSNVASAMGFPPIGEYVLTYKAEYEGVKVEETSMVELFFSKSIASRFFGWTVPYSNKKLEVGIGISGRSKRNSTSAFEGFAQTKRIAELVSGGRKTAGYASMIPLEMRRRTVIGNVMLIGDAAGQVKATTGGGIIFGASCAKIAAWVMYDNIKRGKPLAAYEGAWRRAHGLDLAMHKVVHSSYSAMGDGSLSMAIKTMKRLGIDDFLGTYGDMDRPSLVLKRLFFRGASN